MPIRKQQYPSRQTAGTTPGTGIVSRFFLTLLIFACISTFAAAQMRYTVNRPVTTMTTPPVPAPVAEPPLAEDWLDYIPSHTAPLYWETDYEFARQTAETSSRCLLIYLYADSNSDIPETTAALPVVPACGKFETLILDDSFVRSGLCWYVLLKLPMDTKITGEDGTESPIYSLPGFEHMLEHPGLVVVDFASRDKPQYGEVTGILPFLRGECPTAEQTETFLYLPPGTLTQRTLTYAVRIHPDNPLSSDGAPAPIVVRTATKHALYQAERGVLGHQNFGVRSNKVRETLGGGSPSEICAQSRSGESLFEGAIGCMRAWRHSSGHWSIARKSHRYYGYDMALGKSGAWYAVGFFVD